MNNLPIQIDLITAVKVYFQDMGYTCRDLTDGEAGWPEPKSFTIEAWRSDLDVLFWDYRERRGLITAAQDPSGFSKGSPHLKIAMKAWLIVQVRKQEAYVMKNRYGPPHGVYQCADPEFFDQLNELVVSTMDR